MGASSGVNSRPSTTGTRRANRPGTWLRLGAGVVCLLAVGVLLAPGAGARKDANLSLNVNYTAAGLVTVTLPDGTPVGSTSGAPTVIPAGYYSLNLSGPGE